MAGLKKGMRRITDIDAEDVAKLAAVIDMEPGVGMSINKDGERYKIALDLQQLGRMVKNWVESNYTSWG